MFYLRINKIKIRNNRELLGKAEVQFMSFVTRGESDFPMLQEFFDTNDEQKKKEVVKQAMEKVISSRIMVPIQKVKDGQEVFFGDTGYVVHKSEDTPEDLNWMLLAIELDKKTRDNSKLVSEVLTNDNISSAITAISTLAGLANPVAAAITSISAIVSKAVIKISQNKKDDQVGLLLTSFIQKEHYPHGTRDKQDVPDLTNNMFVDYTIFAY